MVTRVLEVTRHLISLGTCYNMNNKDKLLVLSYFLGIIFAFALLASISATRSSTQKYISKSVKYNRNIKFSFYSKKFAPFNISILIILSATKK